ncbi:MAG: DegV family protein [Anaerolineaceae bacterium]|nr:DegV family protein [Anaerolineaceae bacterium]
MSKVAVVTDSTAYLPEDLIKGLPIHILPLQVIWGAETYRDGIDIKPVDFYQKLSESDIIPSTSQPSPKVFQDKYQELLDQGFDIISIHISAALSGTVQSATQAKQILNKENIAIFDSKVTAMALGFNALILARAAKDGASLEECIAMAEKMPEKSGAIFAVSTLEFLHKGGRIGSGSAFLGTALKLKPILWLSDGKIEGKEKIRTLNKALDRLVALMVEIMGDHKHIALGIIHADAEQQAYKTLEKATEAIGKDRVSEGVVTDVSPVIGTHTGPGTVGISYQILD